jgi:hypothetical protein
MRAIRQLLDDTSLNAGADGHLRASLAARSIPAIPIQKISDAKRLALLRITHAKFREAKRKYDLSREARLFRDVDVGRVKIRIIRPRAQNIGEEKRIADIWGKRVRQNYGIQHALSHNVLSHA